MATHSSIHAWKFPWMEEPGRLQSIASQRVRHDWTTSLSPSPPSMGIVDGRWVRAFQYPVIKDMLKDTNEEPVEEIHRARGMKRSFYTLSVNTFICTQTWKLSKLCTLGNFVEPSSCRFDQSLTQSSGSLLSLEEVGWGKDTSKVLIMAWLFWETDLHPETIQESNNSHPQQNKWHSCHPGNTKILGLQGKTHTHTHTKVFK